MTHREVIEKMLASIYGARSVIADLPEASNIFAQALLAEMDEAIAVGRNALAAEPKE